MKNGFGRRFLFSGVRGGEVSFFYSKLESVLWDLEGQKKKERGHVSKEPSKAKVFLMSQVCAGARLVVVYRMALHQCECDRLKCDGNRFLWRRYPQIDCHRVFRGNRIAIW